MTRGEAVNWLINIMADIGKAEHSELWHYEQALSEIREILESEPEQKAGKWINDKHAMPRCSCCGYMPEYNRYIDDYYYSDWCPNCGADMRGGEE